MNSKIKKAELVSFRCKNLGGEDTKSRSDHFHSIAKGITDAISRISKEPYIKVKFIRGVGEDDDFNSEFGAFEISILC